MLPCVRSGPSMFQSPASVSLASQKCLVSYDAPSSEWDADAPGVRAETAAFSLVRGGDMFFTPACVWWMQAQAFACAC